MIAELQNLLTLVATGAGIYVAVGGLNAWRRETTGKRDIELCQKVIEMFYEAEHKMNLLRSPMSYSHEGAERGKDENETPKETDRRNHLFVPLARFNNQSEFWSEFFSYRFRMRALFDKKAWDAFEPVDDALRSFRAAAITRFNALWSDSRGLSPESQSKFEETIWAGSTNPDEIADKMKEGIAAMQAICVPIVRSTRPWNWLRSLWKRYRPL